MKSADHGTGLGLRITRQEAISRRLASSDGLSLSELASAFDVSPDTIRRDLTELESRGLARRVRGGAVPARPARALRDRDAGSVPPDLPQRALEVIGDASTILLDGGTTALALSRILPPAPGRMVITPAPAIATATHARGIETVTIGGPISERGGIATGSGAENALGDIYAEIVVLGACGLEADHGLSSDDLAESRMKQAMARVARRVCILTSGAKIGRRARHRTLSPEDIDTLVTDADEAALGAFADAGIELCTTGSVE